MRRVLALHVALLAWLMLSLPVSVRAQNCPCSVWSDATVPPQIDGLDTNPGEYGFRFQASTNGYIKTIRFYKSAANTGVHLGNLWSNNGVLLASVTFAGETASGWQQANFSTPVAITAGTTYVASYFTTSGRYSYAPAYFTASTTNGPLEALADGTDGVNGVYAYSGVSTFPTSTSNSANYWVDVVYDTTDVPSVTGFTPASGASNVSVTSPVSVNFSEAMNAPSLTSSSIQLLDPSNIPLSGTVTYNSTTQTATLQPSGQLLYSTAYTVIVHGAAASPAVTNLAGNPMAANVSWSFTTSAAAPTAQCPCTIWPSSTIPTAPDGGDGSAGEYGVRFQVSQSGYILGIRYYKSQANLGTHVGNLWSNAGALLATATSVGESASGWQQVNFNSPVPVTAGLTYVASYFTPAGHYAYTNRGLSASVVNPPLTALADGTDGLNAVYSYSSTSVFPTSSWQSSNYWVDVVYSPVNVPSVIGYSPLSGVINVPTGTTATATFNEALDPSTVNGNTVQLLDSTGTAVSAAVTYNAPSQSILLTPTSLLAASSTYTAILRGGSSGLVVQNTQGVPMPANFSWSFTTGASTTRGTCPCGLWGSTSAPVVADSGDTASVELGVKFTSDISGYVTGVRFFKSALNGGTHIGNLWTSTGTRLASATFTSETASGWQQISFGAPVAISPGVTYVASYFAPQGHYAFDQNSFVNSVDNPPLHALSSSSSGGNGVNLYSATSVFPINTYNATNYWVDVVFISAQSAVPPTVVSTTPAAAATQVAPGATLQVVFSEAMDPITMTSANFQLQDAQGNPIPGTLTYSGASATLTFQPSGGLLPLATYTATVKGQVKDFLGNTMGPDYLWSFTTQGVPSDFGPGGPLLVISSRANPFTRYLGEILLGEGLNEFSVQDITQITPSLLARYDTAILGDMSLTSAQANELTSWVNAGGNLIALHPDPQLAGLLGITSVGSTLANAYLQVNTASAPGAGIVGQTMQFHGSADLYTLNGATTIASLYSNAATQTSSPAVAWHAAGAGKSAVFTYDLARSVVYTRQGNPAWSGESRDPYVDPAVNVTPIRSDDLFYGQTSHDPQPDWVDLNKVQIPQADEQQRLLVNIIQWMQSSKKPLPRFWYFPGTYKAAIIMTGDDHNNGGTPGRFDQYLAYSAPDCVVEDWTCVRSTSYVFPGTAIPNYMTYVAEGFEIASHHDNIPTCSDFTAAGLDQAFTTQAAAFAQAYPGVPASLTNRTHCVLWSDYDTEPQVELNHGIRLDTTYYYWPDLWVNDRPGLFTGSGLPQRYADRNGNTLDVYQATTQFPDETTWTYPNDIDTILDNAIGPLGYYAALTANMHTDQTNSPGSDQIVQAAQARGVPIISAQQMLTWLDGRNSSAFNSFTWDGSNLGFAITAGAGARNLQALLPMTAGTKTLATITLAGSSVPFAQQTIKGLVYASFAAVPGTYTATYGANGYYAISGQITGSMIGGVKVNLTGPTSASTTTDSSGNFSFAGLPNGAYAITPAFNGYVFSPATQSVTLNGRGVLNVNFASSGVEVQSITVTPAELIGGIATATGTVTLTGPAANGGTNIIVGSNDTTIATTPDSVVLPAGATSANFTITTLPVAQTTTVYISAVDSANDSNVYTELTVDPPGVQSLVLSPSAVTGGTSATGTVTLGTPAGVGGVVVTLSSNNTAAASVPSRAVVAAGAVSAAFSVTTSAVATPTTVTITATSGTSVSAPITVNPPALSAVSLNPSTVTGGNNVTGTVNLNGPAPSTGLTVALQSSSSSAIVPTNVVVARGASSGNFTISTKAVATITTATITATYGGNSKTASLTLMPPVLQSVSLSPNTVTGGTANSTATVTLTGSAPAAITVSLASSNSAAASVPSTVTIAANAASATFTVTSHTVLSTTALTISAIYNGTASAALTVTPLQIKSVSLSPGSVVGGSTNSTATITLNGPAPYGGATIALASDNTAAASIPASVVVGAGATAATATVTTEVVSVSNIANIKASYNGGTASTRLTVLPLQLSSVTVNPTSVVGGASSTGTVTLNGTARTGGAVVTLTSNNPAAAVASTVTVASGSSTATFSISTAPVTASIPVTVSATYITTASTSLTVTAPQVHTLTLVPTSVTGGTSSTGTVTLTGPAATGGYLVSLTSSRTSAAQVPATVMVAAGATSATFTVATIPVASNTTSVITAGGTATATLTINAPTLAALTLNPTTVRGGFANSTGTLTLTGPAPSAGSSVLLSSSNTTYATVPANVTVAAGKTSATFTVATKSAGLLIRTVVITGTLGVQRTATLTVTP